MWYAGMAGVDETFQGVLGLVNKLSSILPADEQVLAGCGFGWRCQQNSDYQPVGLRFASLPALSSLEPKRNLISLPVLNENAVFV